MLLPCLQVTIIPNKSATLKARKLGGFFCCCFVLFCLFFAPTFRKYRWWLSVLSLYNWDSSGLNLHSTQQWVAQIPHWEKMCCLSCQRCFQETGISSELSQGSYHLQRTPFPKDKPFLGCICAVTDSYSWPLLLLWFGECLSLRSGRFSTAPSVILLITLYQSLLHSSPLRQSPYLLVTQYPWSDWKHS